MHVSLVVGDHDCGAHRLAASAIRGRESANARPKRSSKVMGDVAQRGSTGLSEGPVE